mmetsp:Transcript_79808/g.247977  ORF Transcript_79808/g.247977 Transcript_79808/m.247977 type:complete len:226 (-) Transcript_79808:100-777(-)
MASCSSSPRGPRTPRPPTRPSGSKASARASSAGQARLSRHRGRNSGALRRRGCGSWRSNSRTARESLRRNFGSATRSTSGWRQTNSSSSRASLPSRSAWLRPRQPWPLAPMRAACRFLLSWRPCQSLTGAWNRCWRPWALPGRGLARCPQRLTSPSRAPARRCQPAPSTLLCPTSPASTRASRPRSGATTAARPRACHRRPRLRRGRRALPRRRLHGCRFRSSWA